MLKPGIDALALSSRDFNDLFVGKARVECVAQLVAFGGIDQINFVDHDQIRFLELLLINVANLFRKGCTTLQVENPQCANWIDQYAERRDGKALAIDAAQRIADGRHQISATADWLGYEDIGPRFGRKFPRGLDQGIEATAKATACNFFHAKTARSKHRGIDKLAALIICDQPETQTAGPKFFSQAGNGGSLPRAQKPADHDVNRFIGRLHAL